MLSLPAISLRKNSFYAGALLCGAVVGWVGALGLVMPSAWAQSGVAAKSSAPSVNKLPKSVNPVKTPDGSKPSAKPAWQDLTPAQQLSLQPLAANWGTLDEAKKRKWIAVAANYAKLSPTEQAKLHSRMNEWTALSQQQRTQARLNFARAKKISPSQKTATWEAYQSLSPEEKKKLAVSGPPKPVGAAAASKPVPPQKLTKITGSRQAPKQAPQAEAPTPAVNRNTLLPYSTPTGPASAPPSQGLVQ